MAEFLQVNRDLILFVYGLVFFELGLAIALQSRTHSRLDLARSLRWLALFGLAHGVHEWGDVFIPIQATYLSPSMITLLRVLQLILLAGSFAFLLEFGLVLMYLPKRHGWLYGLPVVMFITWLVVVFFIELPMRASTETWQNTADALARYFLGFPGGVLAAYGFARQARLRLAYFGKPGYVQALWIASLALGVYAIFSGLVPPAVSFFPGNLINASTFQAAVGMSPVILRSIAGLVLVVAVIYGLEIFDLEIEHIIESMEQQQILNAEHERIGRELHDGAIQKVYTAGLLVQSAKHLTELDSPLAERLDRAVYALNDAISDLRRNLGELRADQAGEPLETALRRTAGDPRFQSLVDIQLEIDLPGGKAFPESRAGHVLAIVNEALSNAIRHGRAHQVKIHAWKDNDSLHLEIQDNGVGIKDGAKSGYGLRNMQDRARLLSGQIEIEGKAGKGTTVTLVAPWKDER